MADPSGLERGSASPAGVGFLSQLRSLRRVLLVLYLPLVLGICALVVVNLAADVPLRSFFNDPVAEFAAPMYIGLVSNFGVVLWGSAASACLFGGWLLLRVPGHRSPAEFLLASGAISAMLMFDDLYLLHEEVLPERLHIPQPLVFAAYGALLVGYFVRFRNRVLTSEYALLLLALGFFAVSIAVDLLVTSEEVYVFGDFEVRELIEDGFKVFGIVSWTGYYWRLALHTVGRSLRVGG